MFNIQFIIGSYRKSSSWVAGLKLVQGDKQSLEKGDWLDDRVMNSAQQLLKRQFPSIDGFHSTLLVSANQAPILKGGAIQLLFVASNHWLCAVVSEDKSEIKIYDSLYSTAKISVMDKLIDLIHSNYEKVTFNFMNTHQQSGTSDCGVFAIAAATSICHNEDLAAIQWDQSQMRGHLITCLERERMKPFPRKENLKKDKKIIKTVTHTLHCICRKRHKPRETMKQCAACCVWFHAKCLNIPTHALAGSYKWTCNTCLV